MTAHPRLPQTIDRPQTDSEPAWNARDLTAGGQLATIVLDGQAYFLRITRAGKLILTK
jgi:hemin uptake protein HemP